MFSFFLKCLKYNNKSVSITSFDTLDPDSHLFLKFIKGKVRAFVVLTHDEFDTIVPVGKVLIIGLATHCYKDQCVLIDIVNLFGEFGDQFLSTIIFQVDIETFQMFEVSNVHNYRLTSVMIDNINHINRDIVNNFEVQNNSCVLKSDHWIHHNDSFDKFKKFSVRFVEIKKKFEP